VAIEADGALVDPEDLISHCEGFWNVVGDNDGGEVVRVTELQDLLEHGISTDGVESGGGFIEEHEFGVRHESSRDSDTFLHSP
jgi:hypothetical protein